MTDKELLLSHVQHFKTVWKRWALKRDTTLQWCILDRNLDVFALIHGAEMTNFIDYIV